MKMLKNKRALSTVVTTLIILVVSVLLATVVTFYAINVTTTRVQEEGVLVNKLHVWCDSAGDWATSALQIINIGGKDIVIDKLNFRGQESAWANVYYNKSLGTISPDLLMNDTALTGASVTVTYITGSNATFSQATDDITLKSGDNIVLYIASPDTIAQSDIGVTVGVTIFTQNAQYYKECNVEASE